MKQLILILLSICSLFPCKAQKPVTANQQNKNENLTIYDPKVSDDLKKTYLHQIDSITVPSEAILCPCNRIDLLLANNELNINYTLKDLNLKGSIKNIITTTHPNIALPGISLQNTIEESLFSKTNLLLQSKSRKIKQKPNDLELYKNFVFQYNDKNLPAKVDLYLLDSLQPIIRLTHVYDYNDTLLKLILINPNEKTNSAGSEINFKCWQQNGNYLILQNIFNPQKSKEQILFVYNADNNLIRKEKNYIDRYKDQQHTIIKYFYDEKKRLIKQSYLSNSEKESSFVTIKNDAYGNIIKELWENGDYNAYQYKYDAKGNWIWKQKTVYEKNIFNQKIELSSKTTFENQIEYY